MNQAILDRYRCPEEFVNVLRSEPGSNTNRFFRFGTDVLCYGQTASSFQASSRGEPHDLLGDVKFDGKNVLLPFDATQIVDNLRRERYVRAPALPSSLSQDLYYLIRPLLPVKIRRHLQRAYFHGWQKIAFPHWPVDLTVEQLFEKLLLLIMQLGAVDAIPFIWFWPDGASSAAIMTHDVETTSGRDFCSQLMDINATFAIPSAFQVVPEKRYTVPTTFLDEIRNRGNEVNIQDLNHDGRLFHERREFEARVKRINHYGRAFAAKGFRAAVLYRNMDWFDMLEFEYDMSVPNVGHLEAQRGGCCTVFPYFIGNILELPVTTTQDYSLFHIFGQYNLDLWKVQASSIAKRHGLMSFIAHPDYLRAARAQDTYRGLLSFLDESRTEQGVWVTTPGEINQWWRERNQMRLVRQDRTWKIEGPGRERARIAYARNENGLLVYSCDGSRSEPMRPVCTNLRKSGDLELDSGLTWISFGPESTFALTNRPTE